MFGALLFVQAYQQAVEEKRLFDEICAAMPEEEANKLREKRRREFEEERKHRRALEIADAGRARNFWGK